MRIFAKICIRVSAIFTFLKCTAAVDNTIVAGSTGTSIVEACVFKIRNAGIFPEDYDFLRNLGYVDSLDGAELNSEPGGIWKVSEVTFTQILNSSFDVVTYYAGINSSFGISWTEVVYDNLTIPMYSALARRLHIAYLQTSANALAIDTEINQALVWALNVTDSGETTTYFTDRVAQLPSGCDKPNRDVVFMIDSSIDAGSIAVANSATFVKNVLARLEIDTNQNSTVIGLAQFSNEVQVLSYLNSSKTQSDFIAILSTVITPSGARFTGRSVAETMFDFFQNNNGARQLSSGTPRVLCVLVAGDSQDSLNAIEDLATMYAVNVIAVAMKSGLTQAALSNISTGDDTKTTIVPSSFPPESDVEFAVAKRICTAGAVLSGGSSVSGTLQQNDDTSFSMTVPATGMSSDISTSAGNLAIYYSALKPNPSEAYYDYSLNLLPRNQQARNQQASLQYTPTTEELQGESSVNLYINLQGVSSTPTVYSITVSDSGVTISVNVAAGSDESADSGLLSDGQIAGITFSCLILLCAIIIAVVYYRFGRPPGSKPLRELNKKFDRPLDSSETENVPLDNLEQAQADANEANTNGNTESQERILEMNVRERLQSAMKRRDYNDLNDAIEDFIAMKLEDFQGDFVTAQRMVAIHQCKLGLSQAMASRNVKGLEKAIFKAKRMPYDVELKIDLVNGEILLQNLKKTDNLLRRLKRAIDGGDTTTERAIRTELRVLHGCDEAGVGRMLLSFQFREDIEEAMVRRDIKGIHESMTRIREKGFEDELAAELRVAKKLAKDLSVIEKARQEVMGLKQSKVSEIRSYATPPAGVHEIMMSVYLLLGYHPTQLQSWTAIQALMGKTGREGLRRMISDLELKSVDIMFARMAKSLLENFDLPTIKELSSALAVFYIFTKSVVKEVEKLSPESDSPSFYEMSRSNGTSDFSRYVNS